MFRSFNLIVLEGDGESLNFIVTEGLHPALAYTVCAFLSDGGNG